MELKTPLYDAHVRAGGKIVPFAGFLLPVQYEQTGVIKEHMAVRTEAGLFDVSHMGEVLCKGKDALANLQKILTNNFENMVDGQARYSLMCNENGGVVDDLIVYKRGDNDYFIVVNAANREKDFNWMVALQGPKAMDIIRKLTSEENIPKKYYTAVFDATVDGIPCIVSKTGYTGEDGVELYLDSSKADEMWEKLLAAGKEEGLVPCGLGARDTLRMEAAMPLYGHEMDDEISPLETGLNFAVKMDKPDFIGKAALEAKGEPKIKRVGLKVVGRGVIREHQDVMVGDQVIGHTTSGTHCPFLNYPVGMALIDPKYAEIGTQLQVDVRGRKVDVEVVALPFYKRAK